MIIVEGPDGSGKSTIVTLLSVLTKRMVRHNGGPPGEKEAQERINFMFDFPDQIFERCTPISELVYGRAVRGRTVLPEDHLWTCIDRAIAARALFVYCRPPKYVLKRLLDRGLGRTKPWKSDKHVQGVKDNYDAILDLYDSLFTEIDNRGGIILRYERVSPEMEEALSCAE